MTSLFHTSEDDEIIFFFGTHTDNVAPYRVIRLFCNELSAVVAEIDESATDALIGLDL